MTTRTVIRFALSLRFLHWLMAILILAMLAIGITMATNCIPAYAPLKYFHVSVGVSIFVLALIRLIVRLSTKTPPLPSDLPLPMKIGAIGSQILLYGFMFAMPVIGVLMLQFGRYPVKPFGMTLPAFVHGNPHDWFTLRELHTIAAACFFAVIILHISAALFHRFVRRDHVLQTML